jgi:hypothetical protein
MENTYRVAQELIGKVTKKVEAMNRKAKKLNIQPLETAISESFVEDIDGQLIEFVNVSISGEDLHIEGWKVVASIETEDKVSIIREIEEIPARFRSSNSCEHCNMNRKRKYTVILKNDKGEFIQVGKTCLKDFTGQHDAEGLLSYYEMFNSLEEWVSCHERDFFGGGGAPVILKTAHFLALTLEHIERIGKYVPASAELGWTTASDLWNDLYNRNIKECDRTIKNLEDHSEANLKKAEKIVEYFENCEAKNNYLHNLKMLAQRGFMKYREKGFVASMAVAYQKAMNIEQEEREAKKVKAISDFVGEVKERLDLELTVNFITQFENDWGVTTLYKFKDSKGNSFSWFSSNEYNVEVGDTIKVRGTVKKHDEYKGEKQTILTRCKIA